MFRNDNQSDAGVQECMRWRSSKAKNPSWESGKVWQTPPTVNILAADENPNYRYRMKETLLLSGYTVYAAENGLQSRKILNAADIDLIVCDLQLPIVDGIELRRCARQMQRHERTKFILMSENRESNTHILISDPTIDFFFDKAAPMSEMVKFVDELIFGSYAGLWK